MHTNAHVNKKYIGNQEYFLQEGKQLVICFEFLRNKVQKYCYIVS